MMPGTIRLGLALGLVALFVGRGAVAGDLALAGVEAEAAKPAPAVALENPPVAKAQADRPDRPLKRRLTTAERWRGKPYLRAEDSLLRGEALNRALPPSPANVAPQGVGLRSVEAEELRRRALDMALPKAGNPILPGGF